MEKGSKGIMLFSGLVLSASCMAGPADYLYTPKVERGELELDIKYGASSALAEQRAQEGSIGLGYGVTERWFTEAYVKQERIGGALATFAEWENRLQLLNGETLNMGFVTELEAPINGGGAPWEIRLGPLFQTQIGKLQLNYNVLFEKAFGNADESGVPYATNLGYQWQARYHWQPELQFGIQGFGEVGAWDKWEKASNQNHRMGPAIFGEFSLDNGGEIKYNFAWLFGVTTAAPNQTLRSQLEYEF